VKMLPVSHVPGRHCASTGIRNLLSFHGIQMSEAMCFGIGAGLGIGYLNLPGSSPSRLVHVRSVDFEEQFFSRIGHAFVWDCSERSDEAEASLCRAIDRGLPSLIRTDIYHLPYFRSNTHFPGHVIMVWGYDHKREVFFVTDTGNQEILEVPFSDMRKARHQEGSIYEMRGNRFSPEAIEPPGDMRKIIIGSIVHNSRMILDEVCEFQGIRGLDTWLKELPEWVELKDWRWIARFCYQVIERRGTGGGGFRLIYADFLREALRWVPEIASNGLVERMSETAAAWQGLAAALKEASEQERPDFREVAGRIEQVRTLEDAYHRAALALA
jgi:hypothetical protein